LVVVVRVRMQAVARPGSWWLLVVVLAAGAGGAGGGGSAAEPGEDGCGGGLIGRLVAVARLEPAAAAQPGADPTRGVGTKTNRHGLWWGRAPASNTKEGPHVRLANMLS